MKRNNATRNNVTRNNTIIILREDYSHTVKKSDVWLVYTLKTHRPWVAVPDGITFGENTVSITLATGSNGGSFDD